MMILNLFVLVAILCSITQVSAKAEPHSGAHPGSKVRVAEAEPHSGAHPGAKAAKAHTKATTAQHLDEMTKKLKTQLKQSSVEKKAAPKREFVRGQKSVRLESVQQPQTLPQPTHVAGNRLLSQMRIYDSPDCAEDSLFAGAGNAANVCVPEENEFPAGKAVATSYTVLKVNSPEGVYLNEVQSYFWDRYCTSAVFGDTIVYDSVLLDDCAPAAVETGFEGKFAKHFANKDVLLPTSTKNRGVLLTYYGGKRGCEERDMLGLTSYTFAPEECMPDVTGSFKPFCDENGPKISYFTDANCSVLDETVDVSDMCAEKFYRADCITQPPQPPVGP